MFGTGARSAAGHNLPSIGYKGAQLLGILIINRFNLTRAKGTDFPRRHVPCTLSWPAPPGTFTLRFGNSLFSHLL